MIFTVAALALNMRTPVPRMDAAAKASVGPTVAPQTVEAVKNMVRRRHTPMHKKMPA